RLSAGAVVGPAGPGQRFHRSAIAAYSDYFYGTACPFLGEEGYAGFRFVAGDGALHYGWLRLSATGNADAGTAYEYAYEAAPEAPITTGTISAVFLTGDIDRTAFPPE